MASPTQSDRMAVIADGIGHATAALAVPLLEALRDADASIGLQRVIVTLFVYSWPWSIGLFLPLALLLFPNGRLPSRRAGLIDTSAGPEFVLRSGAGFSGRTDFGPDPAPSSSNP